METNKYTADQYSIASSLIGKTVWFFLKGHLPHVADGNAWSLLPNISVMLAKTVIPGVSADVKKIADENGVRDEYTKLKFILKNPYYIKPEEPEEGAMGFPESTVHSWKEWDFSFFALNKWFFESKEDAINSIKEYNGMYELIK